MRRAIEATLALNPRDLVLVDEALESGPEALHRRVAAGGDPGVVDARLPDVHAVLLGVPDPLDERRRFEHRLGRDAADVEARSADLALVDEGDLEAELRGAESGGVAAGPGAEDDEIEVVGRADGHRRDGTAAPGAAQRFEFRGPRRAPAGSPRAGDIPAGAADVCCRRSGALPSIGRLSLDQGLLLRGLLVVLAYVAGS